MNQYNKTTQNMMNYHDVINKNMKEHESPNQPQIFDHPQRILIIGSSTKSGKTNALLNPIKQQNDDNFNAINKIYLCVKDPNEAKYQYVIKKKLKK